MGKKLHQLDKRPLRDTAKVRKTWPHSSHWSTAPTQNEQTWFFCQVNTLLGFFAFCYFLSISTSLNLWETGQQTYLKSFADGHSGRLCSKSQQVSTGSTVLTPSSKRGAEILNCVKKKTWSKCQKKTASCQDARTSPNEWQRTSVLKCLDLSFAPKHIQKDI